MPAQILVPIQKLFRMRFLFSQPVRKAAIRRTRCLFRTRPAEPFHCRLAEQFRCWFQETFLNFLPVLLQESAFVHLRRFQMCLLFRPDFQTASAQLRHCPLFLRLVRKLAARIPIRALSLSGLLSRFVLLQRVS